MKGFINKIRTGRIVIRTQLYRHKINTLVDYDYEEPVGT